MKKITKMSVILALICMNVVALGTAGNRASAPEQLPRQIAVVEKADMEIVGLMLHTTLRDEQHARQVPPFFHRVLEEGRLETVHHRLNGNQLCAFAMKPDSPEFDYIMAVEVSDVEHVPAQMVHMTLQAGKYAKLTIIKRGPGDVGAAFEYLYESWLPDSGYAPTGAPGFVYYDDRFFSKFNMSGYEDNPIADIYLPIRKLNRAR